MVQRRFGKVLAVTDAGQDSQVQLAALWGHVFVEWTNTIVDHLDSVDMLVNLLLASNLLN